MFSTIQEVEAFFNNRKRLGIKPGLDRINELLSRLDHPERKMKAIHVAGTNGKGSTIHFLNAALQANQYDVGIFTSPSFAGLTGHIFLNDDPIAESDFVSILNEVYPHVKLMDEKAASPTEFEILTAVAFVFFSKNGEIVLVETGMGGRFDTTNTFQPILSIITNVAIDHTNFLGETPAEIAYHKAGIIKKSIPVIVGSMEKTALQVIANEAREKQASSYFLGEDFHYDKKTDEQEIQWTSNQKQLNIRLVMQGEHQLKNVSIALKAIEVLEEMNYTIHWDKAISAIAMKKAPGRFELLNEHPTVIVDAAHNPDGVKAFVDTANNQYPTSKKHVIVGVFSDKDVGTMLQLLGENFDTVTLTTFDHPRAASVEELCKQTPTHKKQIDLSWKNAIQTAMKEDKICFITGSLHFITMVRDYFQEKENFM